MINEKRLIFNIIENVLAGVGAVILAAILVSVFSRQISKISNSVFEKQAVALALQQRSENLLELKKDLEITGNIDKKIESAFPTTDNILEFVSALESLASQYSIVQNLKFGNITPTSFILDDTPISMIDYTLTLDGNIQILTKYLEAFEKLPFFTEIKSITLSSYDVSGWTGNLQIIIQAKVYVRLK